jgi:hypothetical protein
VTTSRELLHVASATEPRPRFRLTDRKQDMRPREPLCDFRTGIVPEPPHALYVLGIAHAVRAVPQRAGVQKVEGVDEGEGKGDEEPGLG